MDSGMGVRSYVSQRFPPSQAGTVLSGYVCCYLLYGQVHGAQVFGWPTVVGAVSAVLLSAVRRLVDDVEDLRGDVSSGRFSFPDGGRAHLRGLVFGAVALTAAAGALNATCGLRLLLVSVGVALWVPVATVIKHLVARPADSPRSARLQLFLVNETCPAVGLLYPYAVWQQVSADALPAMAVISVIGLFWTTYQFWNFTRKVGTESWPPWFLTTGETRVALVILLALAAAFSALLTSYARLPVGYAVYALLLSAAFAVAVLRWWARLPSRGDVRVGAAWGGIPFAVGVQAGVLLAILAS